MFCTQDSPISCWALALFTTVYGATEATVLCPDSWCSGLSLVEREVETGEAEQHFCTSLFKYKKMHSMIILLYDLYVVGSLISIKKCAIYPWKIWKLHLQIPTKQASTFHMECVCLCDEFRLHSSTELMCIFSSLCFLKVKSPGEWYVIYTDKHLK